MSEFTYIITVIMKKGGKEEEFTYKAASMFQAVSAFTEDHPSSDSLYPRIVRITTS